MNDFTLKAMAKVNLSLDVVRRREDGYHEVRMVMQNVRIFDRLTFHRHEYKAGDEVGKIIIKTNLGFLPTDENNLVYKAAKLLMDEYEVKDGVTIDLDKHIPVAAGMAGGSSDAAATLVGINKMFGLNLSTEELMERGVKIGADVPYCVLRGTALSEGIGEILTPLKNAPNCYVLVAKPGISVPTKYVYTNLSLDENTKHPDVDGMIEAINEGDLKKMASLMDNVLETVTIKEYPIIDKIKQFMKDRGALNALMSGSGPTVFGLFDNEEVALDCYEALKAEGLARNVFLTDFFLK